jgi:hypothetical protein
VQATKFWASCWESHSWKIYWASKLLVDRAARQVTQLVAGRHSSFAKPQSFSLLATSRLKNREERARILGLSWYTRFRNLLYSSAGAALILVGIPESRASTH